MKKLIAMTMALMLAMGLCACKKETPADVVGVLESPAPDGSASPAPATGGQSAAPVAASYGNAPAIKVTATAAHVFDGEQGVTLYASARYENTGDCPVTIASAKFDISAGGSTISHEFTPELSEYLVLLPGETSYLAQWLPADTLSAGAEATLSASLTPRKANERGVRIGVENLYIADNYPSLSTLSGKLVCPSGAHCGTNMIWIGFYGDENKFLGAWYFTKNALLEGGDEKNFVVNMADFPLKDMASLTKTMEATGFGFDFA